MEGGSGLGWNFQADRPIYAQLMEEIKRRIISGVYKPGEKMPSVRDLAAEASVNPNTMQRAFAQLEQEGLLYTQRTSGRFVTEDEERIMDMKNELAKELIRDFWKNMEQLGFGRQQTLTLLTTMKEECDRT